jgi:hypothetical protein
MGTITEYKNPDGKTNLVVYKTDVARVSKMRLVGFYNYELKIHGVNFGTITGTVEIKFDELLHRMYRLLLASRGRESIFMSQELTEPLIVLAMVNNLDLLTGRTWSDYEIFLPEWNSIDTSNIPDGFELVPSGDCHRMRNPQIYINYI